MRKTGVNKSFFSGVVRGEPTVQETSSTKTPAASFPMTSEREGEHRSVSCTTKINTYNEGLVKFVKANVTKGAFIIVEGELMNRDVKGLSAENSRPVIFTEIRAWNLIAVRADGTYAATIADDKMSDGLYDALQQALKASSEQD